MTESKLHDSVYPMPGGVFQYFQTALDVLSTIQTKNPTFEDFLVFLKDRYKVEAKSNARCILAQLRRLGWLVRGDDQRHQLTVRGREILATQDSHLAFEDLKACVRGMEETLEIMSSGAPAGPQLLALVNQRLGTQWKTPAQPLFRVYWLKSLGMVPGRSTILQSNTRTGSLDQERNRSVPVTTQQVRALLEQLSPDPAERAALLGFFADAVETAHGLGAAKWSVKARERRVVRLNIGRIAALGLCPGEVQITLDLATLGETLLDTVNTNARARESQFKVLTGLRWFDAKPTALVPLLSAVRPAFDVMLRRGAATVRDRTPFYGTATTEVLEAIEQILGRTLPRPDYGDDAETPDQNAMVQAAFLDFLDTPGEALRVGFARRCAERVRSILSKEGLDLSTFERAIWRRASDSISQDLADLLGIEELSADRAEELAVSERNLPIDGNGLWSPETDTFGPNLSPSERADIVAKVGRLAGDAALSPVQKLDQLLALPGLGPRAATGIAACLYPAAIAPDQPDARKGLGILELDVDELAPFQDLAMDLKSDLGAEDFVVLDHFLRWVAAGRMLDQEGDPDIPETTSGRVVKIAPGEDAHLWNECRDGGYIAVGWDTVGDLHAFATREAFEKAFEKAHLHVYRGNRSATIRLGRKVWSLLDLRPGDRVLANRGKKQLLAVGEVLEPGYVFRADRSRYKHTIKVRWDLSQARSVPEQHRWFETIVWLNAKEIQALGLALPPKPPTREPEPPPAPPIPTLDEIHRHLADEGLSIDRRTLRRYHVALQSRRFVVLAGPSGTGKTWLARAYADAVEAEHIVVPVAPNWASNEDLLGFLHPVHGTYVNTPFSSFVRRAAGAWVEGGRARAQMFHVVLDEMNLARVEHYFARFLSAMELCAQDGEALLEFAPGDIVALTPNLCFIGTVNVDETTHGFADKVFDRAQLLELTVNRALLVEHLGDAEYGLLLLKVWDAVHEVAPFAFRTLDDIAAYIEGATKLGAPWEEALDEQVLQKVLPRIRGGDPRVEWALEALRDLCGERLPLTRARSAAMLESYHAHGFATFF
ncbi:MAG: AAA family ATPase [Deltaproteobacteria bacterium]|nr:AAA family ATPase [Deltaproteobacteria bacterium]